MCVCDRVEAKSFRDSGYLLQHPSINAPSAHRQHACPGAAPTCCCGANGPPPLQNNRLAHPFTQKATVFGRVHYTIGQPCSSESTHAPLPEHRNNADRYSYLTGAYLAQCIDCICLLKVFKNVHVAFFARSICMKSFLTSSFNSVQTDCHPAPIAHPLTSHLQEFSLWLCIFSLNEFSSQH